MWIPKNRSDQFWRDLAQEFINSKDDEECISMLLRMQCIFGGIKKLLRCSEVYSYRFEYPVPGGRIDLLLEHMDGGVSIIEIKVDGSRRNAASGIGQLFLYEAMFLEKKKPAYVNKWLISPIHGEDAKAVEKACALAGVDFLQFAPFKEIRKHRDICRREWVDHGPQVVTNT